MKKQKGFTLIELMVVVAVVALLATIAYPSYQNHLIKSRRAQAQTLMLEAANRQEQYILVMRQYHTAPTTLGLSMDGFTCTAANCSNNWYTVTIAVNNAAAPPTYTVTATAIGGQVSDGNLTLDSTGAKTPAEKW
jgi:type IV pilus assembly protein PilE